MATNVNRATRLWTILSDALDIPKSLYERAAGRHKAVGQHLCRSGSAIEHFDPDVRPQGSFRFGTVIRPLSDGAEYDLDHVVVMNRLSSYAITQRALKELLGRELHQYAAAHGMEAPMEHNRCWRLGYRDDDLPFHLDSLPCVPAGEMTWSELTHARVSQEFANVAVAITDRRHPDYVNPGAEWLTSNPRGFARWFESRAALGRATPVVGGTRASIEPVPSYEWRTPLQRAIQILKRHRDVFFQDDPEFAPISMIITNLAARAYDGQRDLASALLGIVHRMPTLVNPTAPRVPNPTHPREDYADRWSRDTRFERNFYIWCRQVALDVGRLSEAMAHIGQPDIQRLFAVSLAESQLRELEAGAPFVGSSATAIAAPPSIRVDNGPKPWMVTRWND